VGNSGVKTNMNTTGQITCVVPAPTGSKLQYVPALCDDPAAAVLLPNGSISGDFGNQTSANTIRNMTSNTQTTAAGVGQAIKEGNITSGGPITFTNCRTGNITEIPNGPICGIRPGSATAGPKATTANTISNPQVTNATSQTAANNAISSYLSPELTKSILDQTRNTNATKFALHNVIGATTTAMNKTAGTNQPVINNPIAKQIDRYYEGLNWWGVCTNPLLHSYITQSCDILVTPDKNALTAKGKVVLEGILCPKGPSIVSTLELFYGTIPQKLKNDLGLACGWH